jgi:putative peptidoglycan lipid II flippase
VVNRVFYAQKDTITPLLSSVASMFINIGLALALYQTLLAGGLALSNTVAVTVEVLIMLVIAHRRMAGVEAGSMLNTLGRTLLAAGTMGVAVLAFLTLFPTLPPILVAGLGGFLGVTIYIIMGLILKMDELRLVPHLVRR